MIYNKPGKYNLGAYLILLQPLWQWGLSSELVKIIRNKTKKAFLLLSSTLHSSIHKKNRITKTNSYALPIIKILQGQGSSAAG